jgi:hypothetical protein
MRPRPATRAALVLRNVLSPFSTHEAWGESSFTRTLKARITMHSADRHSRSRSSQINLQHLGGRRPVLPCVEDSCEEAATPGQPSHAEAHAGGSRLTIHPRELSGTAGSAAMLWQGLQDISLGCQHCAPRAFAHQAKIRDPLCRNCGCLRFFVEDRGKADVFSDLDHSARSPRIFSRLCALILSDRSTRR